jgi:hypothetical protein
MRNFANDNYRRFSITLRAEIEITALKNFQQAWTMFQKILSSTQKYVL